jgi:hypothetical protein
MKCCAGTGVALNNCCGHVVSNRQCARGPMVLPAILHRLMGVPRFASGCIRQLSFGPRSSRTSCQTSPIPSSTCFRDKRDPPRGQLDDARHTCQAKTGAIEATQGIGTPVEALENVGKVLVGNPYSAVAHRDDGTLDTRCPMPESVNRHCHQFCDAAAGTASCSRPSRNPSFD